MVSRRAVFNWFQLSSVEASTLLNAFTLDLNTHSYSSCTVGSFSFQYRSFGEWFRMRFRCFPLKFTDQKFVLWDTFPAWYYLDVFSHFQISLPQKNEVNLGFCIARLVSDKVTISFDKESIPNDKIICNSKFKDSITICITFTIPRTSMNTFQLILVQRVHSRLRKGWLFLYLVVLRWQFAGCRRMHPLWTPPIVFEGHRQTIPWRQPPLIVIWSTWFCSTLVWCHTLCRPTSQPGAHQHHLCLVPWSLPTQKNLYLQSFPVMYLAEAPLHLTSCTQQRSMFLLVMVSTISLDLPLMVPMFQEAIWLAHFQSYR